MTVKTEEILVSVICTCFNHEKYIRDALEGFVNQKTSFKYEVIVHDDASTDKSADIIREYEEKYPDIIKPIYQRQNQFSQGIRIISTHMLPKVSGRYIAFCEGDDYWTNPNKLQKQVDFLENNPDFLVCVHNTEFENMSDNKVAVKYSHDDKEITLENIFKEDERYHTSSIMVRVDFYNAKPSWLSSVKGVGDLPMSIYYTASGRVMYFGDVMSHYRYGVPGSWTERDKKNTKQRITNRKNIIKMLKTANKYYEKKYSKIFTKQILLNRYDIFKCHIKSAFPFLAKLKNLLK